VASVHIIPEEDQPDILTILEALSDFAFDLIVEIKQLIDAAMHVTNSELNGHTELL
jgi:hypothetical protein